MKIKISICIILILSLVTVSSSWAQISGFDKVGTTSFQFLKVIPNAQSASMGGASAASIHTSDAVFFNPAMLVGAANMDVSISYLDWFMDVSLTSFSMSYRVKGVGTFGIQALMNDMGDIKETRVDQLVMNTETGVYNPGLTGRSISPGSYVFGLSYARELTNKFSFGLTVKYAQEDLVAEKASSVVFDGGLLYKTGFKSLKLGAMLRQFGPAIKFVDEEYPLPQTFTIGVSGELISVEDAFVLSSPDHKLFMAYDLSQTRDHSQQHHIGLEYMLKNILILRTGYKINFDEEGLTLGFGLKVKQHQLDYSYNDFGDYLDAVHRFTLRFVINK